MTAEQDDPTIQELALDTPWGKKVTAGLSKEDDAALRKTMFSGEEEPEPAFEDLPRLLDEEVNVAAVMIATMFPTQLAAYYSAPVMELRRSQVISWAHKAIADTKVRKRESLKVSYAQPDARRLDAEDVLQQVVQAIRGQLKWKGTSSIQPLPPNARESSDQDFDRTGVATCTMVLTGDMAATSDHEALRKPTVLYLPIAVRRGASNDWVARVGEAECIFDPGNNSSLNELGAEALKCLQRQVNEFAASRSAP
ncbi:MULTISPECIES: hypothetical protein [Sorangium]|uniref:hypothetical protein n=1 Tax=Sorangium TaxID=39643 RepID=UPI003D9C5CED